MVKTKNNAYFKCQCWSVCLWVVNCNSYLAIYELREWLIAVNWKGLKRKKYWPISGCCPTFCVEDLKRNSGQPYSREARIWIVYLSNTGQAHYYMHWNFNFHHLHHPVMQLDHRLAHFSLIFHVTTILLRGHLNHCFLRGWYFRLYFGNLWPSIKWMCWSSYFSMCKVFLQRNPFWTLLKCLHFFLGWKEFNLWSL